MATLITRTLKKDGSGHYTTIDAFLAGEAKDLVAADEIMQLDIYGAGWDFATPYPQTEWMDFNGFTSDATRRIILNVIESDRHDFTPQSGFVLLNTSQFSNVARSQYISFVGINFIGSSKLGFQDFNTSYYSCLVSNMPVLMQNDIENCIIYDLPPATNNVGNINGKPKNTTVILRTGEGGYNGDIAFNNATTTNCLVFKEQDKIVYSAYYLPGLLSDYNGVNRAGEGLDSQPNSLITLSESDFVDFANKDYRLKSTSVFATAGEGGTFMGAAVEAGGGGTTATITEIGPSFTESINVNYSANISGNITESGPSFTESISATLTKLSISTSITEAGPSFTEAMSATITPALSIVASITESGPSFTESISVTQASNILAGITETGPSFVESINLTLNTTIEAAITESGPSFTEMITAEIPIKIAFNPKNVITVKRTSNTVKIANKTNIKRVN